MAVGLLDILVVCSHLYGSGYYDMKRLICSRRFLIILFRFLRSFKDVKTDYNESIGYRECILCYSILCHLNFLNWDYVLCITMDTLISNLYQIRRVILKSRF